MLSYDFALNIYLGQQGGRVEEMPYDTKSGNAMREERGKASIEIREE